MSNPELLMQPDGPGLWCAYEGGTKRPGPAHFVGIYLVAWMKQVSPPGPHGLLATPMSIGGESYFSLYGRGTTISTVTSHPYAFAFPSALRWVRLENQSSVGVSF